MENSWYREYKLNTISKPLIILGGGGHAKVLIDVLSYYQCDIIGITEADNKLFFTNYYGIRIIGNDSEVLNYNPSDVLLVNGIGSVATVKKRKSLFCFFKDKGYCFAKVIHPSSVISSEVVLNEGIQIMAGSVIQPGCKLGTNVLINTKASLDHDCIIGNNVHIAPGVTLSGNVVIGNDVHIGAGTTIIQGVHIGEESLIGAGSVVLRNIPPRVKAYGIPAKVI